MSVSYGGQAVLEGVMMRGPSCWAVAIRNPDGGIEEVVKDVTSPMKRHRIWRLPVIRGVIALGESLAIGFRALAISANVAAREEDDDGNVVTEISRGQIIFSFALAIGFALMLFKVGPALLTSWLPVEDTAGFVIVEGVIRVAVFIAYIALIGLIPDLKRVFQYHGAEHKTINALEAGSELTPGNVQKFSLIHPRCGTAFLLWVMVLGIFVFALRRQAGLVLADREPDPAPARDRRDRLRADPLRGQAPGQPRADDAPRAGPLAAAADDARAVARPGRGLDPRDRGGPPSRGDGHARRAGRRPQGRGDGLAMPRIVREADVSWEGNLARGAGAITAASSGAFEALRLLARRPGSRAPEGKTSPEELLAAAHGGCFTMSLAGEFTGAGAPPGRLDVRCRITMDEVEGAGT